MGNGCSCLWSGAPEKYSPRFSLILIQRWMSIKIGFIMYKALKTLFYNKIAFFTQSSRFWFNNHHSGAFNTLHTFPLSLCHAFEGNGWNFTHSMNLFANMMRFCLFSVLCVVESIWANREGVNIMAHIWKIMVLSHFSIVNSWLVTEQ